MCVLCYLNRGASTGCGEGRARGRLECAGELVLPRYVKDFSSSFVMWDSVFPLHRLVFSVVY